MLPPPRLSLAPRSASTSLFLSLTCHRSIFADVDADLESAPKPSTSAASADLLDFGGAEAPATSPNDDAAGAATGAATGDLLGDLLGGSEGATHPQPSQGDTADHSHLLGDFMGGGAPSAAPQANHNDSLLNFGDDDQSTAPAATAAGSAAAAAAAPSNGGLDDLFGGLSSTGHSSSANSDSGGGGGGGGPGGFDMSDMGFSMPTAPPPATEKPANSLKQEVRLPCALRSFSITSSGPYVVFAAPRFPFPLPPVAPHTF